MATRPAATGQRPGAPLVDGQVPTQRTRASENAVLWSRLRESGDPAARDQLIIGYAPLVGMVARRTPARTAGHVEFDDLVSAGTFGLIDAIDKFDTRRGVPFEAYATSRIRGAIIDELRAIDWAPRSVRSKARELSSAFAELEATFHRRPTHGELAEYIGVSSDAVHTTLTAISRANLAALDAPTGPGGLEGDITLAHSVRATDQYQPEAVAEADATREILMTAVDHLGERTARMLRMYYFEDKTYAEVGKVLGVTESRVSQMHSAAMRTLRKALLAAEEG